MVVKDYRSSSYSNIVKSSKSSTTAPSSSSSTSSSKNASSTTTRSSSGGGGSGGSSSTPTTSYTSRTVATEEGGTMTVTQGGQVTIRDSSGKLVERYEAPQEAVKESGILTKVSIAPSSQYDYEGISANESGGMSIAPSLQTQEQREISKQIQEAAKQGKTSVTIKQTKNEISQNNGSIKPFLREQYQSSTPFVNIPTSKKKAEEFDAQNTIRAATPEQIKATERSRNPIFRTLNSFISGASFGQASDYAGRDIKSLGSPEMIGYTGGLVTSLRLIGGPKPGSVGVVEKGATALKGSKIGQTVGRLGTNPLVKKTRVVIDKPIINFPLYVAKQSLEGTAIVKGGQKLTQITAPLPEKEIIKKYNKQINTAIEKAYNAETEAIGQQGIFRSTAYQVSPALSNRKDVFEKTLQEELKKQGLSGGELYYATQQGLKQRKTSEISEAAALLRISMKSERFGRKQVTKAFAKPGVTSVERSFGELFKRAAPPIALAGFGEGFSQELSQQVSRYDTRPLVGKKGFSPLRAITPFKFDLKKQQEGQGGIAGFSGFDLKPVEKSRLESAFGMGVFGAGTAGLIGGSIAGTKVKRPTTSKVIEYTTYFADPFEKPGDLLADVEEGVLKRVGVKVPTPSITVNYQSSDTVGFGKGKSKGKRPVSSLAFGTPTSVQTSTKTNQPSSIFTNIFTPTQTTSTNVNQPLPTPVSININTNIPIPIDTNIPIPIDSETPVPIDTEIPIPVETQTPIPVGTNIPIPVVTPIWRIPPPVPFSLPFGGGGGGTRVGKRLTYKNELAIGKQLLNSLIIGDLNRVTRITPKKSTSKSKTKKKSKRKKKK